MCQCRLCLLCVFLLVICTNFVRTFNVDNLNYAHYSGMESSSMFGFSIALHKESNNGWLIVGAPEAQSTYQRSVIRGGAVYKCPIDRDEGCQEIRFDRKDGDVYENGQQMDNKTGQWFGATVSAANFDNGPVVACAPRYTWYPRKKTRRDPIGTCFVSNGAFSHVDEYSPCRTFQWGYHRQGSCQAGFSATINSVGDRLFVGAPGSWYWQGQVHQRSLETRPAVYSTTEGSERDDDSYMGYSTTVGDFLGNGEDGIAVGMPRGNNLRGKVLLFTWNLTNFLHHFSSDQLGSYYGYAIAASDVDGDGKVDLIIGAPMYTIQNNEEKYDVGRVYVVYHQSDMGKFVATYVIDGFNSKSRFGQALASLGDINQDGYGDFAVGAPYDGPKERGAVYIYHGSNNGVRKTFSQIIYAEDVSPGPAPSLTTFGFSITGGLDLDGNDYPDMAVGAYQSNKAFFFRSRPVVKVEASVEFSTQRKEIDIKNSNHMLSNGDRASKVNVKFCIKYSGKGIPPHLDLNLQYTLDTKKSKNKRMGFVSHEGTNTLNDTIRIKDGEMKCNYKDVYVKADIRDKLTPLEAEVKYWMQEDSRLASYDQQRNLRSPLKPVLDSNIPTSRKDSISIHKECGSDYVCIPNLNLNVTPNVNLFYLGSGQSLIFDIVVSNNAEDAFESTLEIKYPENIFFKQFEKEVSDVLCNTYGNNTLKCEIGNPIPKDKIVKFKVWWQPVEKEGMAPFYTFNLRVNSTNQELGHTLQDNSANVTIEVKSNSHMSIRGSSDPVEVYFNSSLYTTDIRTQTQDTEYSDRLDESVIGPRITHFYNFRNEGPAIIREAELFFIWPSFTLGGEDLLYLVEFPHFNPSENFECDPIQVNYRGFNVPNTGRSVWDGSRLDYGSDTVTSVKSEVSGKEVKNQETLNKAVESNEDASSTYKYRKPFGGSGGVHTSSSEQHQHFQTSSQYGGSGGVQTSSGHEQVRTNSQYGGSGGFQTSSGHQLGQTNSQYGGSGGVQTSTGHQQFQGNSQQSLSGGGGSGGYVEVTRTNNEIYSNGSSVNVNSAATMHKANSGGQDAYLYGGASYQCYRTTNGIRAPIPCTPDILSQYGYNGSRVVLNENVIRRCYNIVGDREVQVTCDSSQIESTKLRCYRKLNGQLRPIECGPGDMKVAYGGTTSGQRFLGSSGQSFSEQSSSEGSSSQHSQGGTQQQFDRRNYNQRQQGGGRYNSEEPGIQQQTDSRGSFQGHREHSEEEHQQYGAGRTEEHQQYGAGRTTSYGSQGSAQSAENQGRTAYGQEHNYQTSKAYTVGGDEDLYANRYGGSSGSQSSAHESSSSFNRGQQSHHDTDYHRGRTEDQSSSSKTNFGREQSYNNRYGGSAQSQSVAHESSSSYNRQQSEHEANYNKGLSGDGRAISGYYDSNSNYVSTSGKNSGGTNQQNVNAINLQQAGLGSVVVDNGLSIATVDLSDMSAGSSAQGERTSGHSASGVYGDRSGQGQGSESHEESYERKTYWSSEGHNSVGRDNAPPQRYKRTITDDGLYQAIKDHAVCNAVKCVYMRCRVGPLEKDKEIAIALRARVNAHFLKNVTSPHPISISSMMAARISKLPYVGEHEAGTMETEEIFTKIMLGTDVKPYIVPLWVVVLSAVAGTIILLLLVFLLYKVGFFKRNRPSSAPERQPLNRNGYHHGDEAL